MADATAADWTAREAELFGQHLRDLSRDRQLGARTARRLAADWASAQVRVEQRGGSVTPDPRPIAMRGDAESKARKRRAAKEAGR